METFKCTNCGFTGSEEVFENYAVECGFDSSDMICPECEHYEMEEHLGGFEECVYCGGGFWSEGDNTVCEYCNEAIDELGKNFAIAVSEYFGCSPCNIESEGDGYYRVDGYQYMILDEDEADSKVAEYIEDSLWAFYPEFLSDTTGFSKTIFEALAKLGEDGNSAVESIIKTSCGMEEFISEAVSLDGRGHFLSSYDGEEIEILVGDELYFAYRL